MTHTSMNLETRGALWSLSMTRKLSATYRTPMIPERHGERSVYSHHSCVVTPLALHRKDLDLGLKLRARLLTTIPDSTSQKFILVGTLSKADMGKGGTGRHAVVFLDFAPLRKQQCRPDQFEKWYARTTKD